MHRLIRISGAVALLSVAGVAVAHENVQNHAVLDRMNNMSALGDSVETLVTMMRGSVPFNANVANAALTSLSQASAEITPLFEAEQRDPFDEASPDIWSEFDRFSQLATDLQDATLSLSGSIRSPDDLRPAMQTVGQACAACHDLYRVD